MLRSGIRRLTNLRAPAFPSPPKGSGNRVIAENKNEARRFAVDACAWLKEIESQSSKKIIKIAVDAPRKPRLPQVSVRDSELALQRANIQFIKTSSIDEFSAKRKEATNHLLSDKPLASLLGANLWCMCVGFALFKALEKHWECVETYPQAILHWTKYLGEHKGKDHLNQLGHIISVSGIQDLSSGSLRDSAFRAWHDRVDALMLVWLTSIPKNNIHIFGTAPEDQIYVPNLAL